MLKSMKVLILYRPRSGHGRLVEEFIENFHRHNQDRKIEAIDIDSRDGWSMASLYDIVQYPALLALTGDGQLLRSWQGESLPLMNEVAYYAQG